VPHGTRSGRSPAQGFCAVAGLVLVAVGALGFLGNADFAGAGHRGAFLGLDVNGWHNVVHIATGSVLLAGAPNATAARAVCVLFAGAYAVVAALGWIDGSDIVGLVPIDSADNVLHTVLAAFALIVAAAPAPTRRGPSDRRAPGPGLSAAYDASSPRQVFVGLRD
jgi:Domain of unknown function (DUF4383)